MLSASSAAAAFKAGCARPAPDVCGLTLRLILKTSKGGDHLKMHPELGLTEPSYGERQTAATLSCSSTSRRASCGGHRGRRSLNVLRRRVGLCELRSTEVNCTRSTELVTASLTLEAGILSSSQGTVGCMGASRAEVGTLIVAIAALTFSGFTWWRSDQAERRTELRIEQQERQQVAAKIYLGEAPKYVYDEFGEDGTPVRWVVVNFSSAQVVNVWVTGDHRRSLIIGGLQACSVYGLPYGFVPEDLYFTDVYGDWHVPLKRAPSKRWQKTAQERH